MEDDDGERHIRLVHFLANGCTQLARALVQKLVELSKPHDHKPIQKPWSLDNFLYENMQQLSHINKKSHRLLFPGHQEKTDLQMWDLSLLCSVITSCTNNQTLKQDIKQLMQVRNYIYHLGNTNIPKDIYDRKVEIIECIVDRCCVFIDKAKFSQEMKAFLDDFKKGMITKNDADYAKIRQWYENDPIAELLCKVDGLSEGHKLMMTKLEELVEMTERINLKGVILPDTNVELIVKNCNSDKENVICEQLVKLLNAKIAKDIPNTPEADKETVLRLTSEAMAELLSGGRELVDIYQACVNFKIKCPTFENMRDLWVDCMTGKLTEAFKPLEFYIRRLTGCPDAVLEVGITQFEFYRGFEATVMEIAKAIRLENNDVFAEQTDFFKEITSATSDGSDAVSTCHKTSNSHNELPVQQVDTGGTRVVVRLQPESFNQAEHIWEACKSGSLNDKLEKLSHAFEKAYGLDDLKITAKMEASSPYEDIFKYKQRIQPNNKRTEQEETVQDDTQEEEHTEVDYKQEHVDEQQEHVDATNIQEPIDEHKLPFIDANSAVSKRVDLLLHAHKELQEKIRSLGACLDAIENKRYDLEQTEYTLKELVTVCNLDNGILGKNMQTHRNMLMLNVSKYKEEIKKTATDVGFKEEEITHLLQTIRGYLESVIPDLKKEVKREKREIAHKYIEFTSSEILDILASWCSNVGYVLYEVKQTDVNRLKQLVARSPSGVLSGPMNGVLSSCYNYFDMAFQDLIQSTFVVTAQSDYCVRLYKKQLPKITVRWLALDRIDVRTMEVEAMFLKENEAVFTDEQQRKHRAKQGPTLKLPKIMLSRKTADEKFQVIFDNMEFKADYFEILESAQSPLSCFDQLYRFVFFTTFEGCKYSTTSLPIVITTDASQSCCALAAVMWHCYGTDNFSVSLHKNTHLPWTRVSEMLNTKFLRVCPTRNLTEENMTHLKRRLLGNENVPDDTMVSLARFCYEPLSTTCAFSFWKWFLGIYNLVQACLKPYWEDGLIAGFLSRQDAESKYQKETNIKSGSFILRFSDNHITDSIGTQSVFGYLTAFVAIKVQSEQGGLVLRLEALEVADDKKLRGKSLANILKESVDKSGVNNVYKFLFPDYIRREECFDKYCSEDRSLGGYISKQDVFLTDLEQELFAIRNSQLQRNLRPSGNPKQRRNSGSSDSDDSGMNSGSPSRDLRSLSPTQDGFGIYYHVETVMDIPTDLGLSGDPIPDLDTLFISSRKPGNGFENEEYIRGSDADKAEIVETLVERCKRLAMDSPDKFSHVLTFLLSQVPRDILEMTAEQF